MVFVAKASGVESVKAMAGRCLGNVMLPGEEL